MKLESIIQRIISESSDDRGLGLDKIQSELSKILGSDFKVRVQLSTLGGSARASVFVEIHGAHPINGIKQNSPTWMTFWAHDIKLDQPVVFTSTAVPKVLKFRAIKGKDFSEAAAKLTEWIKKNLSALRQLEAGTLK